MNLFYGKTRRCMADKTKRKSITSIDDLTEVIDFLYTIYKSIITNKLLKVHRKVYRSKKSTDSDRSKTSHDLIYYQ